MSSLLETYSHYDLNPDFSILISRIIPEEIGEDKAEKIYETCGIAPINLNPFAYRRAFFKEGNTTNEISVDVNANVSTNSVVTYQDEVHKGLNKLITYNTLYTKLQEYYDKNTADTCLKLLLTGTIFLNDANSFDQPYCYAFDLTPLLEGLRVSDTQSLRMKPCKYSRTFISQFIQLLAVSSAELLGACAFPNFFVLLDWFYRKEYGENYVFENILPHNIIQDFQHIIYSVNWNFRKSQSAFTNLSILDRGFLRQIFSGYKYPDLSDVNIESVRKLSMRYFEYFDRVYGKDGTPTFPVNTLAVSLGDDKKPLDPEFLDWVSKANCGKSTANVLSTKPTAFSSCCRLKSDINFGENGFQNSFGVGSVSVGSHRVCGINLPRLPFIYQNISFDTIMDSIHKILLTHRRYLKELIDGNFLPLYKNNLMFLNKQYSTIGFIGVPEFHTYNKEQKSELDIQKIFAKITECTQKWQEEDKEYKAIYNVEQIPGESMASRLAIADYTLGYNTNHIELYSNQYVPLTKEMSIDGRLKEQAKYEQYTSGGSVLHITMFDNEPLSATLYRRILDRAIELGVTYLGINYAYSVCEHGHVMIGTNYTECPVCTAPIKDVYTRIVGFIVPLRAFSIPRLKEFYQRKSSSCSMIEASLNNEEGLTNASN